ncbi:beta-lactamase/transpeptidase-like protein [Globomyces pollinis-pini]|nr:beta-lactamase/transpeptidase-like protein [Globomyces pollinis-pini]
MLSHRMGLSRVGDIIMDKYNKTADMRALLANLEPSEEFRTSFKYNNHMYMYAGDLVGKLMDPSNPNPTESWMKAVKDVVLNPVGLESAVASDKEFRKLSNIALAHADSKTVLPEDINTWLDPVAPAGSISMNIKDRLRWVEFLINKGTTSDGKTILKPETFQQLFAPSNLLPTETYMLTGGTPPISAAGLGAIRSTYKGETVISHGGNVQGSVSKTCFFPDRKFGIVSLYTGKNFGSLNFCCDIADRLLFKDSKTLKYSLEYMKNQKDVSAKQLKALQDEFNGRNKDTKPSFDINTSLGGYFHPAIGSIVLKKSSTQNSLFQLDLKVDILPAFPMVHFEHDRFAAPIEFGQNVTVTFKTDKKLVQGFVFRGNGFTDDIKDGLYFTKL